MTVRLMILAILVTSASMLDVHARTARPTGGVKMIPIQAAVVASAPGGISMNAAAESVDATPTQPKRDWRSIGPRIIKGALIGALVGLLFGLTRWLASRNKSGK